MKQTKAAPKAPEAKRAASGSVSTFAKSVLDRLFLRSKIWEIRKEVRGIKRAMAESEESLDQSVLLLSKKIDYLVAKIDAYADVDDANHATLRADLTKRHETLEARLGAMETSGAALIEDVGGLKKALPELDASVDESTTLLSKKVDYLLARLDAQAEVDDANHATLQADSIKRHETLEARLGIIEASGIELAGALAALREIGREEAGHRDAALEARLGAIEASSVELAGALAALRESGREEADYRQAALDARLGAIEASGAELAGALAALRETGREEAEHRQVGLDARLGAIEASGAELAGALAALRQVGQEEAQQLQAVLARLDAIEKSGKESAGTLAALKSGGLRSTETTPKPPAAKPKPERKADPSRPFIADIEPFLYGRPITYVDVGAYQGTVFDELLQSQIRVQSAHLIEANPKTFAELEARLAGYTKPRQLRCHNIAVSDAPGVVKMREESSMTHVLHTSENATTRSGVSSSVFEVDAITLDEFALSCGIDRIALLKVDVEGHELNVFEGARKLLESESIDIIYVEAGMDPDATQQVYYRSIEDVLRNHGYRLFKIYEQQYEWLEDSPLLRRINMAFMSARFVAQNPYKLAHDLFALRLKNEELKEEVARFKSDALKQPGHSGGTENEKA